MAHNIQSKRLQSVMIATLAVVLLTATTGIAAERMVLGEYFTNQY